MWKFKTKSVLLTVCTDCFSLAGCNGAATVNVNVTFQAPVLVGSSTGGGCSGITVGDINGDGLNDIVVSSSWDGTLSVLAGRGR